MKKGDVLFVRYLGCLVEVLEVRENIIKIAIGAVANVDFEVWVQKSKAKRYTIIGEI